MWCCVTEERSEKTARIMTALAHGTGGKLCYAPPNNDTFAVWGHKWLGEKIVPPAMAQGRPFWFVDNGYWMPAKGGATGYYSLSYRGVWPVLLENPDMNRLAIDLAPWQLPKPKQYVLLALPCPTYGQMLGLDMPSWIAGISDQIRKYTSRRIVIRDRQSRRRLEFDLAGAAVVVTHSSKVAVDAVRFGIPAIVDPANPAAPVCSTDLSQIESPQMPDRSKWWASLMCQQFTIPEMRDRTAKYWMDAVSEQRDRQERKNVD